ncbi:VCBS domain-containing protein [Variovorax sp. GT1P44]|uniref:VCBS domain-containing protein n=1 Tax=Variovorax sp. GT1P44 TaxID=3443742 RepID=UPI003F468230
MFVSFRPQSHALALEPRILFDGAAASAVDQQHHADPAHAATATPVETAAAAARPAAEAPPPSTPTPPAPHQLVVIDSRIENRDQLTTQLPADARLLVVDSRTDGLAAISAALAEMGPVDSIQIFSHGAAGQFTLGNRTLTSDNIDQASSVLGNWRGELAPGADIQLYGCNVGAGAAGQALIGALAQWTGADVGASNDNTGSAAAGGNWTLEVRSGDVDKPIALSADAIAGFHGLLADASPTVSLPSGGADVLLGGQFSFTLNFDNGSVQDGFAPYVDLFLPATGSDGDGDDGVTFVSASYLGQPVKSYVLTFDAAGNATHPLARDASGNALIINAASVGMRPGDQFVVLELPYGSVSQDQPTIPVQVTAGLSNLADTSLSNPAADLSIKTRGGFQFGNDALDNPTVDPSLVEAALHTFVVHPTLVTLQQSIDVPEGETAAGPNYPHSQTVTVTPAAGQTLDGVVITQVLPEVVQVTSITPGSGGALAQITLPDGTVVTDPAQIAELIASGDTFIASYAISYASLSGPSSTAVGFYVPDVGAAGTPVIDPRTGNAVAVAFGAPSAVGRWTPLDPRDVVPPATDIGFSATGDGENASFVARSIALIKQASLQTDIGSPGLGPGDTLHYNLNLSISDFFAFGENLFSEGTFTITDQLGDGQVLNGPATFSVTRGGVTQTIDLVVTSTPNADGTTTLVFDLARSLQTAPGSLLLGALIGDLAFGDNTREGATTAVIGYNAVVSQSYTPPSGAPHSEINEGDSFHNDATVTGTLLVDAINLTGFDESDQSAASRTIATHQVDIELLSVNGATPTGSPELHPGDVVTFGLSYDLVTGDYEGFSLAAYLPLPLFNVAGAPWSEGTGVGQWALGAGNTNPDGIDLVSSGPGNSVVFDFGSYATPTINGSRIEVQFTMRVGDQPFADQRSLSVLAQSDQLTTIAKNHLISSDVASIVSVAEPVLDIRHGVVATTHGTVSGTTGVWNAPGSAGVPFQGSVTDLGAVDGDVSGIDGGDTLRLATALENRGGGGAFDARTTITLPAGLAFVGNSLAAANLAVHRGDGSLLTPGVDYSVSGNEIGFLDAGGVASLRPGRPGTAADASGENIVVITYDVRVDDAVLAARTLQSTAALTNYASVPGGTDFTPTDPDDVAGQQVASPEVAKNFAGGSASDSNSSAPHTTGSDLVIGESMLYDLIVTVPEGATQTLRVDDLIPPGLRMDTGFNGVGYQILTTTAQTGVLAADFNGTVTPGSLGATSGTLGNDGVGARLSFTAAGAAADNLTNNNSFVIRLRLVASNVIANQAGRVLQNDAQIVFSDPDGDTPNGNVALDRTVALSGNRPSVTVREPTLQIEQTAVTTRSAGVDRGDQVRYIIEIRNNTASSDFDAFDISFLNNLPTQLDGLTLVGVQYVGGATNNGGPDFVLDGRQLHTAAGADIDVPRGARILLTVVGTVNASAASQPSFDNTATVQWTSLDGTTGGVADPVGERTGVDGPLNSGVLNDYQTSFTLTIPVLQQLELSRVGGLPDTPAANPTDAPHEQVTVGEIVRYRVVATLAQGTVGDYNIQVTLQNGLGFINDGTVRLAFISNEPMTSSTPDLITGGTLNINGNENSAEALPITPDLSGAAPTGVLNPRLIGVSAGPNGSTVLTFQLGTIDNNDLDSDHELVSLEFNARVLNQAASVAGASLAGQVVDRSGSVNLSQGGTLFQDIVEPGFSGIDKRVTDFDPNPAGGTGTATVTLALTQNRGLAAFNAELTDSFPGGSGYTLLSLQVGGTTYGAGNLPAGIRLVSGSGITIDFDRIDPGTTIRAVYQVTLPNTAAIPNSNARLTWTSLPDNFTDWGGSRVEAPGTPTGERTGSGVPPNTYVLVEGAGLGVIQGTLWDDTASATSSAIPDGPPLPGLAVSLTWGGLDGNLATGGDNRVFASTTDSAGHYLFGVLPSGVFRIDAPAGTVSFPQPLGDLRVRIDSDPASPLGQVVIRLGEGASAPANAGYVQQNDAPENHLPAVPPEGLEDVPLPISGLTVSDVDAFGGTLDITLNVLHGTLRLTSVPPGVTLSGAGTATLRLNGTVDALNLALAGLSYLGNQDFNGLDTLTILTNDRGHSGDANGNGLPNENPGDALSDQDTLQITLAPVNDPPVANDDEAAAVEAGGTRNSLLGVDPSGNVLANDTDVDIETNDDVIRVISAGLLGQPHVELPSIGANQVVGVYGTLTIGVNGGYQYVVDNDNPAVEALRLSNQTLVERFEYTISDIEGLQDSAVLTVTLHGANDTPVGVNDQGAALEAGGVHNTTPGSDALGNVLANDTDVDSAANGETRQVTGIRNLREVVIGPLRAVPVGSSAATGTVVAGAYGTLTVGADGSYRYAVDNENAAVERMVPGDTLREFFSYQVTDAAGLSDLAELRIVIDGANDNPVASDDLALAQAASTTGNPGVNPSGNVILDASRPGASDEPGGNGIDLDVDRTDQPNSVLQVTGIGVGAEASIPALSGVAGGTTSADGTAITGAVGILAGTAVSGDFGVLRIGADGSFEFDVNSADPTIRALRVGQTLDVIFTYGLADTSGLTDRAQLVVAVSGVNDRPVAQDVLALATERGGVANATPGVDPIGNVLSGASDPDGDPLSVTFVRSGPSGTPGTDVPVDPAGTTISGVYGTLTLRVDGSFRYAMNNANPAVEALRQSTDQVNERFTFTIADGQGASDQAEIIVTVRGQNDNPVAADDAGTAVEAGGVRNATPGSNATGNVLANDSDVDGGVGDPVNYGETSAVSSVRTGAEAATGTAGTLGAELRGSYGWLTLNADGSYSYRVDDDNALVEALRLPSDTLSESFSYTVVDTAGAEDRATLTVTIQGANDAPVATDVHVVSIEAGGVNNGTPGVDPSGNAFTLLDDVDGFGETLAVSAVTRGAVSGIVGTPFAGAYGTLLLNADGTLTYTLDNSNPTVQALRTPADTLVDTFGYTLRDLSGATGSAPIVITIEGRNDNPVAVDDIATALEAGGTFNATRGIDPAGNLLTNDTDVDAGDTRVLTGIRTGGETGRGVFSAVAASQGITGLYGTLTVASDGSYSYQVDNNLAAVQALRPGDTLSEVFSYQMRDTDGATDIAEFRITIEGAWDAPVAANDGAIGVANNGFGVTFNPSRNVLVNDTDVDQPDALHVSGIRIGAEGSGAALQGVGGTGRTVVPGLYGELSIGANGDFTYVIDTGNPVVQALGPLQFVRDTFTYRSTDLGGLNDLAEIRVIVVGVNDPPVGVDDSATAIEAGGVNNAVAGLDPTGNVLANDTDVEGDALVVTEIRTGGERGGGSAGTLGSALRGLYGDLTLNADGSWNYVVDNSLPQVEALRASGQTLLDVFTYTLSDIWSATDTAELRITIDGRNDAPIAADDAALAVEAGGVRNTTPGVDPAGNVLTNDSDVDSVANGETRQVLDVRNEAGQSAAAGQVLRGRFGQLTLGADGSYSYALDNANPTVEALRTAGETLQESFTYRMRDTAGATSEARLHVLIQGANDAPVALDDSNTAQGEIPAPHARGNVMLNDSDVDGGDSLRIVAIRTGDAAGAGTPGALGQALVGHYGTLVLNADGSYTYTIDQTNRDVLGAAGAGQVLRDTFTYTVADREGATDLAQLIIHLDIPAPYVAPSPDNYFFLDTRDDRYPTVPLPEIRPVVFIGPVVEQTNLALRISSWGSDGSQTLSQLPAEIESTSLGAGLGYVPDQHVARAVAGSRFESSLDLAWILGREGRLSLSADGLLANPSLFTVGVDNLTTDFVRAEGPVDPLTAQGFQAQLRAAAQRLNPWVVWDRQLVAEAQSKDGI